MIAEFCTWCREYVINMNQRCEECKSCLKCQHFEDGCCMNEIVVSEYRKEWHRPDVLGIGPPLCRKYCPYLSDAERHKASVLSEGGNADRSKDSGARIYGGENGRSHTILFTPLPKFWLSDGCECITFEASFSETIYYHMVLLGWCEWEATEHLTVEIPNVKQRVSKTAHCVHRGS